MAKSNSKKTNIPKLTELQKEWKKEVGKLKRRITAFEKKSGLKVEITPTMPKRVTQAEITKIKNIKRWELEQLAGKTKYVKFVDIPKSVGEIKIAVDYNAIDVLINFINSLPNTYKYDKAVVSGAGTQATELKQYLVDTLSDNSEYIGDDYVTHIKKHADEIKEDLLHLWEESDQPTGYAEVHAGLLLIVNFGEIKPDQKLIDNNNGKEVNENE